MTGIRAAKRKKEKLTHNKTQQLLREARKAKQAAQVKVAAIKRGKVKKETASTATDSRNKSKTKFADLLNKSGYEDGLDLIDDSNASKADGYLANKQADVINYKATHNPKRNTPLADAMDKAGLGDGLEILSAPNTKQEQDDLERKRSEAIEEIDATRLRKTKKNRGKLVSRIAHAWTHKGAIANNMICNAWDNKYSMLTGMAASMATKASAKALAAKTVVVAKPILIKFGLAATATTHPDAVTVALTMAGALTLGALGGAAASVVRTKFLRHKQKKENARRTTEGITDKQDLYELKDKWVWTAAKEGMSMGIIGGAFGYIASDILCSDYVKDKLSVATKYVVNEFKAAKPMPFDTESLSTRWSSAWGLIKDAGKGWYATVAGLASFDTSSVGDAAEKTAKATLASTNIVPDNSSQYGVNKALLAKYGEIDKPKDIIKNLITEPTESGIEIDEQHNEWPYEGENEPVPEIEPAFEPITPPAAVINKFPNLASPEVFGHLSEELRNKAIKAAAGDSTINYLKTAKAISFSLMNDTGEVTCQEAGGEMVEDAFTIALNEGLLKTPQGIQLQSDLAFLHANGAHGFEKNIGVAVSHALYVGSENNSYVKKLLGYASKAYPNLIGTIKPILEANMGVLDDRTKVVFSTVINHRENYHLQL